MHTRLLTADLRAQLPPFVREYLTQLIQDDCQFEEDEQVRQAQERDRLAETIYAEVTGTIDQPYTNVSKQVKLWIASHDHVQLRLHIGGSGCWIEPDSHYFFFHPIEPTLLPVEADRQIWWVIANGYTVYRIQVRQESEVTGDFPDIG